MTGETWPQGTVAMVTLKVLDKRMIALLNDDGYWCTITHGAWVCSEITAVRPLLVLDPDDAEQMRTLEDAYLQPLGVTMADAVRALLPQPTPTKPDEPTGFGARARLRDGLLAVRCREAWRTSDGNWAIWANLDVVEVLDAGEPS